MSIKRPQNLPHCMIPQLRGWSTYKKSIHQQTTRNNIPVTRSEKATENEVEQEIISPPMPIPKIPPKRPRRTIANYQREREAKRRATEALKKDTPQPITQEEDEAHYMETIFQPLPRLHTTSTPCNIGQHAVYHFMGRHLKN